MSEDLRWREDTIAHVDWRTADPPDDGGMEVVLRQLRAYMTANHPGAAYTIVRETHPHGTREGYLAVPLNG